ncbi:YecH family metal-binding protein [Puniceicoccus vermicola]|uniref:YecH family protein n=1 Tax=Puniceicoccus vermicola TaxID=388746 RepID=A0A7X1E5V8_9BACT|nr:YecH family metal-binding protein [Puniceicoccus vermicola]MBC2603546.1 YecH family protein [Puniceicoccus vermicola]
MISQAPDQIHGHAVLEMMAQSDHTYTRTSLIAEIKENFGDDARFVICSGGNMTAEVLVDTLAAKGKFVGTEEAFQFDTGTMCNH